MGSALVAVGAVVRSHGLRGELRVRPFARETGALVRGARVSIDGREYAIDAAAAQPDGWLLKLRGIDDRDAADALRGRHLCVPRDQLPPVSDDQLYVADLIGCTVHDLAGTALGTVRAVENYGAQELLLIDTPDAREAMIPFVSPIVVSVDLAARTILCDPPEGLLEAPSSASPTDAATGTRT